MIATAYTEKRNVGEYVYQTIRRQIIDWELKPGQQISEKLVSEELKVSRTPVREAFIKLTGEALIEAQPYVGTFVTHIDIAQVEEARFIRESLEKSVALLACELDVGDYIRFARESIRELAGCLESGDLTAFIQKDNEFHRQLYVACGKEMTWNVVETVNSQYNRLRLLCLRADPTRNRLLEEHERIIHAIEIKDRALTAKAVTEHLQRILKETESIRSQYPDYFLP